VFFSRSIASCTSALSSIRARSTTSMSLPINVKGNDYRLVVAIDFEKSIVWIKWIGTHRGYDRIDVRTIEYDG
jgi:mRNA interferase HigB